MNTNPISLGEELGKCEGELEEEVARFGEELVKRCRSRLLLGELRTR